MNFVCWVHTSILIYTEEEIQSYNNNEQNQYLIMENIL